ncbi:hypothetical protein [Phytohabitans rumicis]|uniref:Uncharacterized protein n=1 Tax=Phytohabitans rumicis TaxID=1076125 RepID=A0A6V8L4C1_9ACTN|nr:hypothetical protein [Phytohabitans rumicis]GFJ89479.1 hypothetical protein Prum_031210 [Phytohabitans rumicis]
MRRALSLGEILLMEYERLKDEQIQRIGTRDNLIYATLLSLAGLIAAIVQTGLPHFLLAVPPVCVVLGWTYLVNDEKVSAIGHYVRRVLAPRLRRLVGQPVFGWETAHRADRGRVSRKVGQLAVDMLTFVAPSVGALVVFVALVGPSVAALVPAALEFVLVGVFATQIVRYADLRRSPPVDHHPRIRRVVRVRIRPAPTRTPGGANPDSVDVAGRAA